FPYGTPESMLLTTVIFYVEIVVFTFLLGSSFGQKLLRMRVVNLYGGRLTFWRIILRTALIILVIPALVMDPDGRGLHDRIVGSRVIRITN
ncbi:MAG: RDD family protein, partial [Actinomycetia bacterium]|nr:RDD family protein [Actinomycetes bacterium]